MASSTLPLSDRAPSAASEPVVPLRHHGRLAGAAIALVCLGGVLWSFGKNPNLDWPTIGAYLFKDLTLQGLWTTVWLTVVAMAIGLAGGVLVAVMRLSRNPVVRGVSLLYVWVFRGTPLLVQIIFWGFLGAFYRNVMLGIPFTHITFYSTPTSTLVDATTAALLALGLNEIAYASEIIRAGIQAVDRGQSEAAQALGMTPVLTMRRIILPQAMRSIIPPLGNEVVTMLKSTALVSVIAGHDLLSNLQDVYAQNYKVIPLLVVASLWYLALSSLLSLSQAWLERRFGGAR